MKEDIVDDIFTRLKTILGDKFEGDVKLTLQTEEKEIRGIYGGCKWYIGGNSRRDKKEALKTAVMSIRNGVSVVKASKDAGISHDTVYRFLRKRTRRAT